MKHNDDDSTFLASVRKTLDRQQDAIDDATRAALRDIRYQAINQSRSGSTSHWPRLPLYPALTAAATIAIVASLTLTTELGVSLNDLPTLDDMPLITATDDIMFYQELEFYQWLDAEKING